MQICNIVFPNIYQNQRCYRLKLDKIEKFQDFFARFDEISFEIAASSRHPREFMKTAKFKFIENDAL